MKVNNLLNKKFGKLIVLERSGTIHRNAAWLCLCDCGAKKVISGAKLIDGSTKSCGCSRYDKVTTHGRSTSKLYRTWTSMRGRCSDPNNKNYSRYGGRGIKVCERWEKSFSNFLADMGEKPREDMSIDRIDNNKGYSPENCRWATKSQQSSNKSSNKIVRYEGESLCVRDWSLKTGINQKTLHYRLVIAGWPVERALTEAVR